MIRNTATKHAPWYVVPADNKWFTRLVISSVVVDTLESLKLLIPKWRMRKSKELLEAQEDAGREMTMDESCSSRNWAAQRVAPYANHPLT